jgi:endonuclease-3
MSEVERAKSIFKALASAYPDARCTLNFRTPLELLVATILSAQCTDALVNNVTPELFKKYRRAQDYADAQLQQLARDISRVNFYRNKAKSIKLACQAIVERFGARVPNRMEDLVSLHGVARKTANVVLGNAFGVQAGIMVDTHVMRVSQRLRLTTNTDREKIEQDLMRLVPRQEWTAFSQRMIEHGRRVCNARAPRCRDCPLGEALCPSYVSAGPRSPAPRRPRALGSP